MILYSHCLQKITLLLNGLGFSLKNDKRVKTKLKAGLAFCLVVNTNAAFRVNASVTLNPLSCKRQSGRLFVYPMSILYRIASATKLFREVLASIANNAAF